MPRIEAPNWVTGWLGLRHWAIPLLREVTSQLGKVRHTTSAKARNLLGWAPRGDEEVIVSTAESLIRLGLVKP